MPRRNETIPNKRPVEQYDHKDKKRLNNPPVGLVDASNDAVESGRPTPTIRTWTRSLSGRARRSARASRRRPSRRTSTNASIPRHRRGCPQEERLQPRAAIAVRRPREEPAAARGHRLSSRMPPGQLTKLLLDCPIAELQVLMLWVWLKRRIKRISCTKNKSVF